MFPNPTAGTEPGRQRRLAVASRYESTELDRYESTEPGRYESAKPRRYESAAPVGTGPREQQCSGGLLPKN